MSFIKCFKAGKAARQHNCWAGKGIRVPIVKFAYVCADQHIANPNIFASCSPSRCQDVLSVNVLNKVSWRWNENTKASRICIRRRKHPTRDAVFNWRYKRDRNNLLERGLWWVDLTVKLNVESTAVREKFYLLNQTLLMKKNWLPTTVVKSRTRAFQFFLPNFIASSI